MSREIYTYPNFAKLKSSQNFQQLMKYPQIAVSTDLRKCLTGSLHYDKIQGMVADNTDFRVAEFHALARAIDKNWTSDQSKFHQMILLSEFMRKKMNSAKDNKQEFNWLTGCMRNLSSLLSAITLLEQTAIAPDQLEADGDRNIVLMIEAWKYLEEKDPVIGEFREKMQSMTTKEAWQSVFDEVFHLESLDGIDTVVFHGFYYFTPHQERIMSLLEQAGFHLIFLFAYDERYPYAYEIWDKTYSK